MATLEPCKYCKSPAFIKADETGEHWIIQCSGCPCMMSAVREDNPRLLHLDMRDALLRCWNKKEKFL